MLGQLPGKKDSAYKEAERLRRSSQVLTYDDVFQETSARYRAVEPEQWLQRHAEAGSSWLSWPQDTGLLPLPSEEGTAYNILRPFT